MIDEFFPEVRIAAWLVGAVLWVVLAVLLVAWELVCWAGVGYQTAADWLGDRMLLLSAATGETVVRIAHWVSD